MKLSVLASLFSIFSLISNAQQLQTADLTENFALSVQTIDDFFDRFNLEPNTPAFQYLQENYPDFKFDRKTIIFSLFDQGNRSLDANIINEFATQFESDSATKIRFELPGWYSVLHCLVKIKNKLHKLDLIMEIDSVHLRSGSIGYKWSIRSVKAPYIHTRDSLSKKDSTAIYKASSDFLHPMSHALNFLNIKNIFRKGMTRSYFAKEADSPDLDSLVSLIDKSQLKYVQLESVSYHIFQLPGWIVEVNNFDRLTRNSGWLISKLLSADENEKKKYMLSKLNIR